MYTEQIAEDLFEQLCEISKQGECLEYCDFSNLYQNQEGKYRFPLNLAEPYFWGFKRHTLPEYPLSTNLDLPINMNFIFLEFAYFLTQKTDLKYELYFNEDTNITQVQIPTLNIEKKYHDDYSCRYAYVTSIKRFRIDFGEGYRQEEEKYIDFSKSLAIPSPFYIFSKLGWFSRLEIELPDGSRVKIQKDISTCCDHYLFELSNGMVGKLVHDLYGYGKRLCDVPESDLVNYDFLGLCDVWYSPEYSGSRKEGSERYPEGGSEKQAIKLHEKLKVMERLQPLLEIQNLPFEKFYSDVISHLEKIHSLGVCHFDIKPDNIMYSTTHDKFVLIDFDGVQSTGKSNGWDRMFRTPKFSLFKTNVLNDAFCDFYQICDLWELGHSLTHLFPDCCMTEYYQILNEQGLKLEVDINIYPRLKKCLLIPN